MDDNFRITGHYIQHGKREHFLPYPLPPEKPPFELSLELANLYGETSHALGHLNEMCDRLPDLNRFIRTYIVKEAMVSSAIEGINTTMLDMLTKPDENFQHSKETQLVLNYTSSLAEILVLIQEENMPIATRIIHKAHELLMTGAGDKYTPGIYRKHAVQVGDLIPAPANEIDRLMNELEIFINNDSTVPPLIKSGLVHVQFETIHPFLDGNGRIGRLLIMLMLIKEGILKKPIFYPSYYFKRNHAEYYHRLDSVRTKGDFEGWITFYLTGIKESCKDAYNRAKLIEKLEADLRDKIEHDDSFYKIRETAMNTLNVLFQSPVINATDLSNALQKSFNTSQNIIKIFIEKGIMLEVGNAKRNKLYQFAPYIDLLDRPLQ